MYLELSADECKAMFSRRKRPRPATAPELDGDAPVEAINAELSVAAKSSEHDGLIDPHDSEGDAAAFVAKPPDKPPSVLAPIRRSAVTLAKATYNATRAGIYALPADEFHTRLMQKRQKEARGAASEFVQHVVGAWRAIQKGRDLARERVEGTQLKPLLSRRWRQLRGVPFEEWAADLFTCCGFNVELTQASNDQGVDLVLSKGPVRVVVQVKGYAYPVGNSAVQQAVAGKALYAAGAAAVLTNASFTPAAIALAAANGCHLIDADMISKATPEAVERWFRIQAE